MKWKILLIMILFIPIATAATYRTWAEGPTLLTVGEPVQVQIYVTKFSGSTDSYTITPQVTSGPSYLISISMPSNRINNLQLGKTGNTFATVTALGKIDMSTITFTVDPDVESEIVTTSIQFQSGLPISLPEFEFVGLLLLILLSPFIYKKFRNI